MLVLGLIDKDPQLEQLCIYLCFVLESCLMFSKFREFITYRFCIFIGCVHQIDVSVLYTRIIEICEVVKPRGLWDRAHISLRYKYFVYISHFMNLLFDDCKTLFLDVVLINNLQLTKSGHSQKIGRHIHIQS